MKSFTDNGIFFAFTILCGQFAQMIISNTSEFINVMYLRQKGTRLMAVKEFFEFTKNDTEMVDLKFCCFMS